MAGSSDDIRVAILCKGRSFERWEAECILQVRTLPFIKLVLLIEEETEAIASPGFATKLARYPYRLLLWRIYKRFNLRTAAIEQEDLTQELEGIPVLRCKPELKGKYSQHFFANDLAQIRTHAPDVILRFGFNILRGEILTVARYGVWSFHHADEQTIRGGPGAFWEIYNAIPATGAILQRLTEKLDAGVILRKGFFRTIDHSYRANLEQLLTGTTGWMKQALLDVKNGNSPAENGAPVQTAAKVYTYPRNFQLQLSIFKRAWNKLRFHSRSLFKPEKWNVALVHQSTETLLNEGLTGKIEWLPEAPKGEYYADPFGWMENEKRQLVFEHYDYKKAKGRLSLLNDDRLEPLFNFPHHLSYPFALKTERGVQIIPECFESGKLFMVDFNELLRLRETDETEQPLKLRVLLDDFPAVDATPVHWNNRWWLFCTKAGELSNTELYVFHALQPEGEWTPHANNPVKCDIRSSRPAGTPFVLNGKLYRPAQDCSTTYGAAVVLHEVTELSETRFSEQPVQRLEPHVNWKWNRGLHTVSVVSDELLVIDAKRYAFNFDNFARVLRRKTGRIFR